MGESARKAAAIAPPVDRVRRPQPDRDSELWRSCCAAASCVARRGGTCNEHVHDRHRAGGAALRGDPGRCGRPRSTTPSRGAGSPAATSSTCSSTPGGGCASPTSGDTACCSGAAAPSTTCASPSPSRAGTSSSATTPRTPAAARGRGSAAPADGDADPRTCATRPPSSGATPIAAGSPGAQCPPMSCRLAILTAVDEHPVSVLRAGGPQRGPARSQSASPTEPTSRSHCLTCPRPADCTRALAEGPALVSGELR